VMGSNRQLIAIAICLFALKYAKEKKITIFLILIIIAFNFHASALLFLLYYLIDFDFKAKYLIPIVILAIAIGKTNLPLSIFSLFGENIGSRSFKVALLVETAQEDLKQNSLSLFGLFKRIMFLFVFYYNKNLLKNKLPYYNLMINGYSIGLIFYFLFADSLLILVNRGSLYFNIMESFLLASQFLCYKKIQNQKIILMLLLIFSIIIFFKSIDGYPDLFIPYKGLFINTEYSRVMY